MKRVRVTLEGKVVAEVDVDREMTIVRKAPADIVVPDTEISSKHARLRPEGDKLVVCDLGSTNGTTLDGGAKLAPNQELPFERGQKLAVGRAVVEVVDDARPQSSGGFS